MQELGLMERFADPALFDSLTMGEKAAAGLVTTLMGMGTTFIILVLLWGVIVLTSNIIRKAEDKATIKATEPAKPVAAAATPAAVATEADVKPAETGNEIISVIMAAIAASQGADYVSKLRISKIQRVSGDRTAWNVAGSSDCIESRKF